MHNYMSIE